MDIFEKINQYSSKYLFDIKNKSELLIETSNLN